LDDEPVTALISPSAATFEKEYHLKCRVSVEDVPTFHRPAALRIGLAVLSAICLSFDTVERFLICHRM